MHARFLLAAALSTVGLAAAPARAHDGAPRSPYPVQTYPGHWGGPFGAWYGGWQPQTVVTIPSQPAAPPAYAPGGAYEGQGLDREGWLRECRRRLGDNGIGGAVIGGVVGGVAGNVIAGRGNRVLGTVAGAAVGAVAGAVIDKAEDRGRVQDRCEAMLANPAPAAYPAGYGYGYGAPVMMVPVMMVPVPQGAPSGPAPQAQPCKETVVTEEYYVTVPRRHRVIYHRPVSDKRVRLVPDKRVRQ